MNKHFKFKNSLVGKHKITKLYQKIITPFGNMLSNHIKKAFNKLKNPSLLFLKNWRSLSLGKKSLTIVTALLFFIIGIILNFIWVFPNFILYVLCFTTILFISSTAIRKFYREMKKLCVDVTSYEPFESANYFYLTKTNSSIIYILFPLFFVFAFGVGGVFIYSSISITPTLIWCLIYFAIVVYNSMLAYLQYIRCAVYIYKAANNELSFKKIISPDKEELPPNLIWINRMTKISHSIRNMFFGVGVLYIIAFAVFCFSKDYNVRIDATTFYFLWAIIFVFIVLVFPIVTGLNILNIKRIVIKVKDAYIHELLFEEEIISISNVTVGDKIASIMRNYCISIILKTPNYPIKGKLTAVYSLIATLINLIASAATILQYQGITLF